MVRLSVALLASMLALSVPAKADPNAVRTIITAQLEAFKMRDANAAYALAAPSIKRMFPTAERFIAMVQRGYAPVYNAREPVFLRSQEIDAENFAQEVSFTDGKGRGWTALYTLTKQDDGTWLISGCYLRKAKSQNI